jgi:hypothetical protein
VTVASIIGTTIVIIVVVFSGKYFSMVEKSLDTSIKQSEKNYNKRKL